MLAHLLPSSSVAGGMVSRVVGMKIQEATYLVVEEVVVFALDTQFELHLLELSTLLKDHAL